MREKKRRGWGGGKTKGWRERRRDRLGARMHSANGRYHRRASAKVRPCPLLGSRPHTHSWHTYARKASCFIGRAAYPCLLALSSSPPLSLAPSWRTIKNSLPSTLDSFHLSSRPFFSLSLLLSSSLAVSFFPPPPTYPPPSPAPLVIIQALAIITFIFSAARRCAAAPESLQFAPKLFCFLAFNLLFFAARSLFLSPPSFFFLI